MATRYELQGRTDAYTSGWHPEMVGNLSTPFETLQEAQEALDGLVAMGGDWHRDDLRIEEIEDDGVDDEEDDD